MRALRAMTPTRATYFEQVLRRELGPAVTPKLLDVGCGAGFVAIEMAERVSQHAGDLHAPTLLCSLWPQGFPVVGIDPSESSLEQARNEAARRQLADG